MNRRSLSPFGGGFRSDPFAALQRDMNRLFDDTLGARGAAGGGRSLAAGPAVEAPMNVSETANDLRISVDLPGVEADDVEVTLEGDVLTIRGERAFEAERGGEAENYHLVERAYGAFQRSVQLPYPVRSEDVRADFHNGVLTLTLPKSEQQQRRRIPVAGRAAEPGGGRAAASEAPDAGTPEVGTPGREPPAGDNQPARH